MDLQLFTALLKGPVMPRNVYSEINLHMTWHTKNNDPVLTDSIESRLYHYLEHEVLKTKNVFFHAIGGIEDHIHLVASIPPSLLISEWIGKLKGGRRIQLGSATAE